MASQRRYDQELQVTVDQMLADPSATRRAEGLAALAHLPDLYRLAWRLAFDTDLPAPVRHYAASLAFYVSSPVDFTPGDADSLLAIMDDLAVAARGLAAIVERIGAQGVEPHWRGRGSLSAALSEGVALAERLLPAGVAERVSAYLEW